MMVRSSDASLFVVLLYLLVVPHPTRCDELTADWTTARQLYPGIRYLRVEQSTPQKMVLHALQVNTRTPHLELSTSARHTEWQPGKSETVRETTRNFLRRARARGEQMVVAVNADAWTPWPAPFGDETPADLQGLAVSDGTMVSPANGTPSLVVYKDMTMHITTTDNATDMSAIELAVSGFAYCLRDGQVLESNATVHPRTGLGLNESGEILILVAIDGRQPASHGATTHTLGEWLKALGAHNGINMDGGGSTTMCWWNQDAPLAEDPCQLLNRPVGNGQTAMTIPADQFQPSERATGNNLGVSFDVDREKNQ